MDHYLNHISLTTGRIQRSARSAVDDERVELCAKLITAALAGAEPIVPGVTPQLMLHAKDEGHCLSIRLCRVDEPDAPPVMTIGIAANPKCGAHLWRSLHTNAKTRLVTQNEACPPEPWCAERLDGGGADHPEPQDALQDLGCCLAWAYLERPRIDDDV